MILPLILFVTVPPAATFDEATPAQNGNVLSAASRCLNTNNNLLHRR